jgi:hypothetical protein
MESTGPLWLTCALCVLVGCADFVSPGEAYGEPLHVHAWDHHQDADHKLPMLQAVGGGPPEAVSIWTALWTSCVPMDVREDFRVATNQCISDESCRCWPCRCIIRCGSRGKGKMGGRHTPRSSSGGSGLPRKLSGVSLVTEPQGIQQPRSASNRRFI